MLNNVLSTLVPHTGFPLSIVVWRYQVWYHYYPNLCDYIVKTDNRIIISQHHPSVLGMLNPSVCLSINQSVDPLLHSLGCLSSFISPSVGWSSPLSILPFIGLSFNSSNPCVPPGWLSNFLSSSHIKNCPSVWQQITLWLFVHPGIHSCFSTHLFVYLSSVHPFIRSKSIHLSIQSSFLPAVGPFIHHTFICPAINHPSLIPCPSRPVICLTVYLFYIIILSYFNLLIISPFKHPFVSCFSSICYCLTTHLSIHPCIFLLSVDL